MFEKVLEAFRWLGRVISNAAYRFYWDDCFSRASALSYTTLFALVPVSALGFSMFGVFGIGEEQLANTLHTVLQQILPTGANDQLRTLQTQVFDYLTLFRQNVRALNIVSFAVLAFTAIAMLNTIESALNVVWRVSSDLNVVSKLISFWAVITLGPLGLAVSLYWYAKVGAMGGESPDLDSRIFSLVNFFVPASATWGAITLMYYKLPAARVRLKDAAFGAFIAAVVFEMVKRAFAYYVGLSSTYSTMYGVVATIPLFLFWLYVAWCVILIGAEISYQSGSIRILHGLRKYATDLGEIGAILGLRVVYCIAQNFLAGKPPPTEGDIAIETGSDPVRVRTCLDILSEANIITVADSESRSRALVISPDKLTVEDIVNTFHSKEHRVRAAKNVNNGEGNADEGFLEILQKAAIRLGPDRPVQRWTLRQLVTE